MKNRLSFALISAALLLSGVPVAWAANSSAITSSQIFGRVPGTPVQLPKAPVLVLSCSGNYAKPIGSADQRISYTFTIYNQTDEKLAYVSLADRFDYASFQMAYVFNLQPHELRVVRLPFAADSANTTIIWAHRPSFFLCGSGPDQGADGTIYPFDSLHLSDSRVTRLVLLTGTGTKPVSPFVTLRSSRSGSGEVVGVPIQPDAHFERSIYTPGVPGKNMLPAVITDCGIKGESAFATLYNQTNAPMASMELDLAASRKSYSVRVPNLRPFELRRVAFRLPNRGWQSSDREPSLIFCSLR